tara:strand:+ start:127 stop:576 length:450 start_codon:yes stop_codon:yes gene_type:complete
MTEYRKRSDGSMLYSMQAFRQAHPLTSFPPIIPESVINEFEYDQIQPSTPPTPKYHEKVERDGVEQSGGKWVEKWKVTDMGKTAMDNSQAANARTDRNRLLTESDWTQLGDITLSSDKKTEWTNYRTALRNLPTASGWPWDHTLPTKPS